MQYHKTVILMKKQFKHVFVFGFWGLGRLYARSVYISNFTMASARLLVSRDFWCDYFPKWCLEP